MDQATQQSTARVEERAASSLQSQAEDLVHLMSAFRLGNQGREQCKAPFPKGCYELNSY